MEKRVLFTCVGKTDPVRDLRDGAMLHIIRHYLPQKVYIVLSKEMEEWKNKDDRYNKAIQKFNADFHQNVEIEYLPCGIEDVSDFDAFDDLFKGYLTRVLNENPDAEILFNVSSGTPQMKVAVFLLADSIKFRKARVIQVKTHQGKANVSQNTVQAGYNVDAEIELNEDNLPGAENRCQEPKFLSMKKALAMRQVQALLDNYEYESLKILFENSDLLKTSTAMTLTEHLRLRQDLKTREAEKLVSRKDFGIDLFPIKNVKCRETAEFFLVLQNLSKTGKITEFILRLNPFVIRMQELYLLKKFHFDCEQIKVQTSHKEIISRDKIGAVDPELLETLDSSFKDGFKDAFPSIVLYNRILESRTNLDEESIHYIEFFNTCEAINAKRNTSAHSLYGMDESDLEKTGVTSKKILATLRKLLVACYGKECKEEIFDIYDRVNALIINSL